MIKIYTLLLIINIAIFDYEINNWIKQYEIKIYIQYKITFTVLEDYSLLYYY